MEHIYSVFGTYVQPEKCQVLEKYGIIKSSLSRYNHLAFTSNYNFFNKNSDLGYYVYVIDLNLPYSPYCVTLFDHNITVLKWDDSGRKLLICDDIGTLKVYQCINHLYSDWQKIFARNLQDEKILSATWFCNGSSLIVDSDKKDLDLPANQRLKQNFFQPTAFDLGKKPVIGFVVLTKSGLIWVTTFFSNNSFSTRQRSISPFKRECFNKIDISPRKSGGFLIAYSDHYSSQDINVFHLNISIENSPDSCTESKKPVLNLEKFGSIIFPENDENENVKKPIKFVKFLKSQEAIVVCLNEQNASEISLWKLDDKKERKSTKFSMLCSTKSESFVTSLAVANESIFNRENLFDCIVIAEANKLIKCLACRDLQSITTVSLADFETKRWNNQLQHIECQNILSLKEIQLSWSNSILVGLDAFSQIHLFRLCPVFTPSLDIAYSQYFLEYSIRSGNDFWDILVSLKISNLRGLCDSVSKSFFDPQIRNISKKYQERISQMKIAFHRCLYSGNLPGFTCKSADFQIIKNIRAITETIERVIRSKSDLKENDSPMDKLEQIILNEPSINIDSVLNHKAIDLRDFIVEGQIQASFQHQFQWICDLTLYILSLIPHYDDKRPDKFGILNDKEILKILRKILIIIRCWSFVDKGHQAATPTFLKKQGVDVIGMLFRILTKIAINDGENVDEMLLEECCLIPKKVTISQMETIPMSIGVANPVFFACDKPFRFIFAQDPEDDLRYEIKFPRIQGAIRLFDGCRMDNTRFISLGSIKNDSKNVRACSRCNALSLMKMSTRSPATRSWDQQWVKRCSCGGFWREYPYKFQNV